MIADLNAYHTFIVSLKVPSIQQDFANLKMLGHVYVVEDAVDLAQIVRDVTRYGGSFRPEVYFALDFLAGVLIIGRTYRMYMNLFRGEVTGRRSRRRLTKRCTILVSRKIVLFADFSISRVLATSHLIELQ